MLTIEKEKEIRCMIREKATNRQISMLLGVSRTAVHRVRGTIAVIRKLGIGRTEEVRKLILRGMPRDAIALEALVTPEDVLDVEFYFFLQRRKSGKPVDQCPTCGSMMFSEEYRNMPGRQAITLPSPQISEKQAIALYRIAVDLYELDRLCIITNPLFHHLARRVEPILENLE